MSNDIKLIKLTSGEHLVAKVVNENDHAITLRKPLVVFLQPDANGTVSLTFQLFAPFSAKDEVVLERQSIQYTSQVNPKVLPSYIEVTTGIKTAATPELILS